MSEINKNTSATACLVTCWQDVFRDRLRPLIGIALLAALLVASNTVYAEPGPLVVLQKMTDRVMEVVKQDPAILDEPARLRELADELVVPHVDFLALSQWVLGKHWRNATPGQRQVFADQFRELLIRTYLASVTRANYQDQIIHYLPLRKIQDSRRVEVEAHIEQSQGPQVHVQFRMLQRDDGWKVYDVVVEGVSLVTTHRSSFSNIIREQGLDGLIATLEQRNQDVDRESALQGAAPVE
ncbi:MAG: ABC transporter substrate-binding protein [Halobacteria archaeon]|nr:ABC transporter substrate-binding protein [Halobacteria archaeon]